MRHILYKYRGIQNFRFLADILLRSRLFAARYQDLNDPMEGQYYYGKGELDKRVLNKLSDEKSQLRLCSLSRTRDNELMWSHYAEGHRGVAITVGVDIEKYDVRPVRYTGPAYLKSTEIDNNSPREILSHKADIWKYEEEERVFISNSHYIDVRVKEVITGRSMSNQDFSFIKDLVAKIDPLIHITKADSFM